MTNQQCTECNKDDGRETKGYNSLSVDVAWDSCEIGNRYFLDPEPHIAICCPDFRLFNCFRFGFVFRVSLSIESVKDRRSLPCCC